MTDRPHTNSKDKHPELQEITKFLNEVFTICKPSSDIHYFFRGEPEYYKYKLPNWYRCSLVEEGSEYYYRSLLNQLGKEDYLTSASFVRILSELQHYEAKTRLLDVSRNPLIALFIAVEKCDNKDGYIYVYPTTKDKEKFDTGHTVAVKCALSLMKQDVINKFLRSFEILESKGIAQEYESDYLERCTTGRYKQVFTYKGQKGICVDTAIKDFMEALNQRARVNEKLRFPYKIFCDLRKAQIVIPSMSTDRIKQQQGAFIFPCYPVITNGNAIKWKQEISASVDALQTKGFTYVVPRKKKKEIREQLSQLGITKAFVYPSIKSTSETLLEALR